MTNTLRVDADDATLTLWLDGYSAEQGWDSGEDPDDRHFHQLGGYEVGYDALNEVLDVAAALSDQVPALGLTAVGNGEGTVDGFLVRRYVEGTSLAEYVEWKHITDGREATGIDAALGYARSILTAFNRLTAYAVVKGADQ